jgi:phosphatidylinositol phospholipase C delta
MPATEQDPLDLRAVSGPSTDYLLPLETDTSHSIASYFVSSSHNTYLAGHQLTGKALASRFTTLLTNAVRCVEADCWPDGAGDIKVTHGWTATDSLPFKEVCEAIAAADDVDGNAFPIVVSLECHVPAELQPRMVQIMKDAFGDRLITQKLGDKDSVVLADVMNKILVKVR